MFVSFLTYTTLFFWARGDIRTNGPYLWNLQRQQRPAAANGVILSAVTWGSIDLIAYVVLIVFALKLPQFSMSPFTGTPLFSL
jgi:hypothetical protein